MQTNTEAIAAPVPREVLDIAVEAARAAGGELAARFRRAPSGLASKRDVTDVVSDADRAAESAIGEVLKRRRPHLCQRSGLRVHRLPPLEPGLAPRFLAAREPLAAEVLALIGPGAKERRRAARRPPLSTASVAEAMRRRAR